MRTPDQVAEFLGLSGDHVCDLIKAGVLAAHNFGLGRRPLYRVPQEALDDFLARTRTPQSSAPAGVVSTAGA